MRIHTARSRGEFHFRGAYHLLDAGVTRLHRDEHAMTRRRLASFGFQASLDDDAIAR
jgi:hypothetical protein